MNKREVERELKALRSETDWLRSETDWLRGEAKALRRKVAINAVLMIDGVKVDAEDQLLVVDRFDKGVGAMFEMWAFDNAGFSSIGGWDLPKGWTGIYTGNGRCEKFSTWEEFKKLGDGDDGT